METKTKTKRKYTNWKKIYKKMGDDVDNNTSYLKWYTNYNCNVLKRPKNVDWDGTFVDYINYLEHKLRMSRIDIDGQNLPDNLDDYVNKHKLNKNLKHIHTNW